MLQEKAQLRESLGGSLSLGSGFSVELLKMACLVLFVRNGEGHLQGQKVGGRQGLEPCHRTTETA